MADEQQLNRNGARHGKGMIAGWAIVCCGPIEPAEARKATLLPVPTDVQGGCRCASPWVRAGDLAMLFCSWDLARRCVKAGWLTPVIKGKRRTIYRLADVWDCLQRIESGELPASHRTKGKA